MSNDIESFLEMMVVERGLSHNTISSYSKDLSELTKFFKLNDLKQIDSETIRNYFINLAKLGISSSTIARKISCFKQFFGFLYAENLIKHNPTIKLESPKLKQSLPKYLTVAEINKLLQIVTFEQSEESIRLCTMLELLYATGMRISELISLKLSSLQLDREKNLIKPFLIIKGKGDKERMVAVNSHTIKVLGKYLEFRKRLLKNKNNLWLFPSNGKEGYITRQRFGQLLKEVAIKANIEPAKVSPHIIRHSFATHLLENGADLRVIQELLGHANISTTQIYTHIQSKKLQELINNHHPLAKYYKST